MMKVERVMQDFVDPLASFSCTTPYFLQTSLSVSASSRIETPCWSRKSAWRRQSSGLTPSTTQSWRGNTSSGGGKISSLQRAVRRAVFGIEIEHDVFLAPELAEVHRLHVGVREREKRRRLPRLQCIRRAFGRPERRFVCACQVFLAGFKVSTDYNRGDENATVGWIERDKISVTILAKKTAAGPQCDSRL